MGSDHQVRGPGCGACIAGGLARGNHFQFPDRRNVEFWVFFHFKNHIFCFQINDHYCFWSLRTDSDLHVDFRFVIGIIIFVLRSDFDLDEDWFIPAQQNRAFFGIGVRTLIQK